ncbi:LysR family transcriptional regulator [Rhizobium multihospitium]|uniref:HTH-type transcriptional regulator TtuA n=1 Tax=Rhizobium multihospitium TaxID=410764 RepID=A0A1C3W0Y3_9HYPH|nr:LysR family transcriptional regulator [Rhizobium multihospitium]SCB33690.1 DNA-binding transcriptional regulator, LysR family [Rhizobium multihospitium]
MLSLRQFQQFLAVAETMNFHRAAERLNMAQPPLTNAIRLMEEEIGVRLFERTNRITGLTPAGEVLREEARRTIAQAERAVALAKRAGEGIVGTLRIGFVASAIHHLVPRIVAEFRNAYPLVALELEEATSARQIAAIMADRMDIGLVALPIPPGEETRVSTSVLLESQLVAAIPASHPSASAPLLPLAALAEESWVLFPESEGPGLHSAIIRACAEAGFSPRVGQRAVQMETIVGLVAASLGVSLVPEAFLSSKREGVIFRQIDGIGTPIPYQLGFAWRNDQALPVLSSFLRFLDQLRQGGSLSLTRA